MKSFALGPLTHGNSFQAGHGMVHLHLHGAFTPGRMRAALSSTLE